MHFARKGRARVVAGLTACLVEHNRVQQLARRVNSADVQLHQPSHPTSPGVTSRPGAWRGTARVHARQQQVMSRRVALAPVCACASAA